MEATPLNLLLVIVASLAAGFVNAVAGGGTLISFPALTFVGVPIVSANITNTVALSPGYLGGTLAQKADLATQRHRMRRILPAAALGGVLGGVLLLRTSAAVFQVLVPYLILLACGLLAAQNKVRDWVEVRRARLTAGEPNDVLADSGHLAAGDQVGIGATIAVFIASIYGGYFGAGLGIILLAVMGSVINDSLVRINALKQSVSLVINVAASLFFVFSGKVVWSVAAVMAVGSLAGGSLGGRFVPRMNPTVLRIIVIAIGVVIAMAFFVKA